MWESYLNSADWTEHRNYGNPKAVIFTTIPAMILGVILWWLGYLGIIPMACVIGCLTVGSIISFGIKYASDKLSIIFQLLDNIFYNLAIIICIVFISNVYIIFLLFTILIGVHWILGRSYCYNIPILLSATLPGMILTISVMLYGLDTSLHILYLQGLSAIFFYNVLSYDSEDNVEWIKKQLVNRVVKIKKELKTNEFLIEALEEDVTDYEDTVEDILKEWLEQEKKVKGDNNEQRQTDNQTTRR